MKMTFRWFGDDDHVTLEHIRQVPGMHGIVSSLHDIPAGEPWSYEDVMNLKHRVEACDLRLSVIESVPVHEDVKLGRPGRDDCIEAWKTTLANLGRAGVNVVCYNFMPVFDWMRTDLAYRWPDGSTSVAYRDDDLALAGSRLDNLKLPGWDLSYPSETIQNMVDKYRSVSPEMLSANLAYFLERVVPAAEEAGVRLAIHPDDPPWPIFGLPRVVGNEEDLARIIGMVNSPANGLTFCTGSLGANPENDLTRMIKRFGSRIHFAHCRNVRVSGEKTFEETSHLSKSGSVDMTEVLSALLEVGFSGPMRPDHGRMIWGEEGRPGYGLFDRALGATYLNGIWEALQKGAEVA